MISQNFWYKRFFYSSTEKLHCYRQSSCLHLKLMFKLTWTNFFLYRQQLKLIRWIWRMTIIHTEKLQNQWSLQSLQTYNSMMFNGESTRVAMVLVLVFSFISYPNVQLFHLPQFRIECSTHLEQSFWIADCHRSSRSLFGFIHWSRANKKWDLLMGWAQSERIDLSIFTNYRRNPLKCIWFSSVGFVLLDSGLQYILYGASC